MYENGRGVRKDYVQAHKWYNLAAARLPEMEHRDQTAANRDAMTTRMPPEQVAEAQALARAWRPAIDELWED
jgi:TPR repeat protein